MKCSMRSDGPVVLAAIVSIVCTIVGFSTPTVFAAGGTAHLIIGEEARQGVRDRELRDRLEQEKDVFQHGTLHPDVYRQAFERIRKQELVCNCTADGQSSDDGHIRKPNHCKEEQSDGKCESPGGERAEDVPNWVNTYLEQIDLDDWNNEKKFKKLAFLYGAVTHIVTDAYYDRVFVNEGVEGGHGSIRTECDGSTPEGEYAGKRTDTEAAWLSDWNLDFCLNARLQEYDRIVPRDLIRDVDTKEYCARRGFGFGEWVLPEYGCARRGARRCAFIPKHEAGFLDEAFASYEGAGLLPFKSKLRGLHEAADRTMYALPKTPTKTMKASWKGSGDPPEPDCGWARTHFVSEGLEKAAQNSAFFIRRMNDALGNHLEEPGRYGSPRLLKFSRKQVILKQSIDGEDTELACTRPKVGVCPAAFPTGGFCGDGERDESLEECDDGNFRDEDGCSSSCEREECGDGVVQAGLGEQCDDGNTVDRDGCSGECAPDVDCPKPRGDACFQLTRDETPILLIKDSAVDRRDLVKWHWKHGECTLPEDFGDPTDGTRESMTLELVDDESTSVFKRQIPAGGTCGPQNRDCWSAVERGYKYVDPDATTGVEFLLLKSAPEGRSRIEMVARGGSVEPPALPVSGALTARLTTSAGTCFEARYPNFVKNRAEILEAVSE